MKNGEVPIIMCQNSDIYGIQKGGQHFRSKYRVMKIVHRVCAFYHVGYATLNAALLNRMARILNPLALK
jgi:hypothetical protein